MKEGSIVLGRVPQADGKPKIRPAIILRELPSFQDLLACGISSQIHQQIPEFGELITTQDDDFYSSGLKQNSLIRLGFLGVLTKRDIVGIIGSISPERHKQLLHRLSDYLVKGS